MGRQLMGAARTGNLPRPSAPFVGRQEDLEAVAKRYADPACRLLTLVGPGGIGKTRLALEAAARMQEQVRDGAWFVALDALADPILVPQAVASALGLRDIPDSALVESLGTHLRTGQVLLLLDNCEHVLAACAELVLALLSACPGLLILATSREPLHVPGEVVWPLEPLRLPSVDPLPALQELLNTEAVELFVDRAQRVFPTFSLTPQNAPDVVQVCTRLDGLPLAIELAAAWVKVLSVAQMVERLDDRFRLLADGQWPSPSRHQTLQAALDWSYDLLSEQERTLFLRLAIFSGSYSLEAAEKVCAGEGLEEAGILELLRALVDKSLVLVLQERGQPRRYRLLDTVRQHARQHDRFSADLPRLGDRHLEWYLGLAEELEPYLWGAGGIGTLHRLDLEEDNFRAALQWSVSRAKAKEGLRLAAALGWYWYVRARLLEGRRWLEQTLVSGSGTSYLNRARALSVAGVLALQQQDAEQAGILLEEGLSLVIERGPAALEGWLRLSLGRASLQQGRLEQAGQQLEQCRTIFDGIQEEAGAATVLLYEGILACYQENYSLAEVRLEQSLPRLRQLGDAVGMARALIGLGLVARHAADLEQARVACTEAFQLAWERGARVEIALAVEGLAGVACDQGLPLRAARLLGAAAALRKSIGAGLPTGSSADYRHDVDCARTQLGQKSFESAWDTGGKMALDRLRQYVESEDAAIASAVSAAESDLDAAKLTPLQAEKQQFDGLTRRERQVASLVALGMTNKEIAAELVVAVRTVEAHVTSMLSKLGFSSRTQLATWAVDKGLAPPPRTLRDRMKQ